MRCTLGRLTDLAVLHPILAPVSEHFFGHWSHTSSRLIWTIIAPMTVSQLVPGRLCEGLLTIQLLPSLLPSRMTRSLKRAPVVLSLLLPIVTFIIIGRTVEVARDRVKYPDDSDGESAETIIKRALANAVTEKLGLEGTSSAGAGISASLPIITKEIEY